MVNPSLSSLAAVLLAAALGLSSVAGAQTPPRRIQGKVVAVSAGAVTVDNQGAPVVIQVPDDAVFQISATTTLDAIKPGSFIGTTNVDVPGGGRATEVHVFPPGVRIGEGQRVMIPAGAAAPAATLMTNGTVQGATLMTNGGVRQVKSDGAGIEIDVTFPGGNRKVFVPADALLTELRPAERSMLKPGIVVAVLAQEGPDGKLTARFMTTGPNGGPPAR